MYLRRMEKCISTSEAALLFFFLHLLPVGKKVVYVKDMNCFSGRTVKDQLSEVLKSPCQDSGFRTRLVLFPGLRREKNGVGEIVGYTVSVVVTPLHSKSKGFWGNMSLRECQL